MQVAERCQPRNICATSLANLTNIIQPRAVVRAVVVNRSDMLCLFSCYRTMEHPQIPEGSSSFIQLPDEVLATVINTLTLHALGNPGDVCRLMLVGDIAQLITKADAELDCRLP